MSEGGRIDVQLLRVLYLVLQEKSVSRAADKLGITQPAVSSALKRLRDLTGDQLIVRTRNGMVATERALAFLVPLKHALDGIDRVLDLAEDFNPKTTTRTLAWVLRITSMRFSFRT